VCRKVISSNKQHPPVTSRLFNQKTVVTPAAVDLGIREAQDDVKLNLGACLLRNAMRTWALAFSAAHMSGAPIPGLDDASWPDMPRFSPARPPSGAGRWGWRQGALHLISELSSCRRCASYCLLN
jgi:hypothetical protein